MIDIKAIRERADAATPGPWSDKRPEKNDDGFTLGTTIACMARGQCVYADPPGGSFPANDQRFIAAARTDIPALCDEVEKLREALKQIAAWKSVQGEPTRPDDTTFQTMLRSCVSTAIAALGDGSKDGQNT